MSDTAQEDEGKEPAPEEEAREAPLQYEEEWIEEVERRVREIRSGEVELVPGEEVFRSALERLRRSEKVSDKQDAGGARAEIESRAVRVEVTPCDIVVELEDGTEHSCPLSLFPILADAPAEERQIIEIWDEGSILHWPEVDEHIHVYSVVYPERMRGISVRAALHHIRRNRGLRYLGLSQGDVPPKHSDAFVELVRELKSTFRDQEGARDWLRRRPPAIQGRRPLDLIRSGESEDLTGLLSALNLGNSL